MPPAPEQPWTWGSLLALLGIAAGLLVFTYFFPPLLLILGGLTLLTAILSITESRRLRKIAQSRPDESICTFARSFARHSTDPWIIRAVWQEFQGYLCGKEGEFPMQANDRIEEDYRIDWEDVGDMVERLAFRTGRSMEAPEQNPYYDQVRTVGDLVRFMNNQPLSSAA